MSFRPLATVAALCLALAAPALASSSLHGITPLSPKAGATVPLDKSPTFRARVKGKGQVWVIVCGSAKKGKEGVICSKKTSADSSLSLGRAKKHGGVYQFKPTRYVYPQFWMSTPGTYYWQAYRIACSSLKDCAQEGPVVKFKVG
jgi:hypothetical protein